MKPRLFHALHEWWPEDVEPSRESQARLLRAAERTVSYFKERLLPSRRVKLH